MRPLPNRLRRARRGNGTITALSFLTITGFAALAVDLGYAWTADFHLQAVSDAAAVAAVPYLDGTDAGVAAAEEAASWIASQNAIFGHTVALTEDQIEFGYWDTDSSSWTDSADATIINAIRVNGSLQGLTAFFGGFTFGSEGLGASTQSLAIRPDKRSSSTVDCYLPFALPACVLDSYTPEEIRDIEFKLQPAGVDNLGWARPDSWSSSDDHANTNWIKTQLGDCEASGPMSLGSGVNLDNGAKQAALQEIGTSIENNYDAGEIWDDTKWGTIPTQMTGSSVQASKYSGVIQGPIMLFGDCPSESADTDTEDVSDYCDADGGSWSGTMCVTQFAWAAIYDAKHGGSADQRNIKVHLDIEHEYEMGTGTSDSATGNITYQPPPALVY